MHLIGLGTAVPPFRFTQAECWEALKNAPQFPDLTPRSQALLRRVLSADNGIATRHMVMSGWDEAFVITPDTLHARFARHAPELATQAAERALAAAHLSPSQIDAVIISTCTGQLCPGLTSHVNERLGLRPDVQSYDLVGQGCGAALPNARLAEALLSSGHAHHVLSVCVEICSAALYLDNDPGVLISACLFADGAAATVWSSNPVPHTRTVEWTSPRSIHSPSDRDSLRFEQRNGLLRNILTREVPALAAKFVGTLLDQMLELYPMKRSDITGWILHGGGREILAAIQNRLGLREEDLRWSAGVLREFGNVSSPFVWFALEKALARQAPGGWWWVSSFGAGFSCHGAFLKVD